MNTASSNHPHFEGKDVAAHLKEARAKGLSTTMEIHGIELSGHFAACVDALRETVIFLSLLLVFFSLYPDAIPSWLILVIFSIGWFLWKTGRSALLGWARLERLHRLIEEERWEIEHHRAQEKEELRAMYAAKGLRGKLLDEVVEVLMADDNRLLQIMLQEELGLQLESYEHPLKQSIGAGLGVVIASSLFILGLWTNVALAPIILGAVAFAVASGIQAKKERNHMTSAIIWPLMIGGFAAGVMYFLTLLVHK